MGLVNLLRVTFTVVPFSCNDVARDQIAVLLWVEKEKENGSPLSFGRNCLLWIERWYFHVVVIVFYGQWLSALRIISSRDLSLWRTGGARYDFGVSRCGQKIENGAHCTGTGVLVDCWLFWTRIPHNWLSELRDSSASPRCGVYLPEEGGSGKPLSKKFRQLIIRDPDRAFKLLNKRCSFLCIRPLSKGLR